MQSGVGIHLWIKFFQGNDNYAITDSLYGNHLWEPNISHNLDL